MANVLFKGFKLVTSAYTAWTNDTLYFVRTNDTKDDGYIRLNNKIYGTGKDVEKTLRALIGTLPEGYTAVTDYIAAAEQAAKDYADAQTINDKSGHTITLNGADIKIDGYTKATEKAAIEATDTINVALGKLEKGLEDAIAGGLQEVLSGNGINVSAVADNKQTVSVKINDNTESFLTVDADGLKLSGVTDAINTAKEDAKGYASAYTDTEIAKLDAEVSGESHDVKVTVKEENGKLTNVVVDAPDFANTYDVKGAAASAETNAKAYTDTKVSAETAARETRDNELYSAITAETTARETADTALDNKITAETEARATADATLGGRIDEVNSALTAETAARETADTALDNKITAETANREAADAALLGDATATTTTNATIYDVKRALSAETAAREAADTALDARIDELEAISGSSHSHANKDVLDGISAEKVAAWDAAEGNAKAYASAYTDTEIAKLDAEVSGESHDVKVTVKEENGKLTEVTVNAPDFAATYDVKGAAASAETNAKAYTDSAITALDAVVTGSSSAVTITVTETDGKLTAATADIHISAVADNALEVKDDGLFAAIYYEDLDA